ncbi:MAG: hypothetical protein ACYC1T_10935 [Sulfuricaulis sp.]
MEEFKSLEEVTTVDVRNTFFVLRNRVTGEARPQELKDHYESVSRFTLNRTVPEKVQSRFNTAKNILLYTWFVYDFYPVAELQALSALEFALRERIGEESLEILKKQKKPLGMRTFIEHAVENKWIKNEDFGAYHRAPMERAKKNYLIQKIAEMNAKGLDTIEIDYDEIQTPVENTTDYLGVLMHTVHKIRNIHAHGEAMLYPASVWMTFEICSDFINALFQEYTDQGGQ